MATYITSSYAALESTRRAHELYLQIEAEANVDRSHPKLIQKHAAFVNFQQAILLLSEHRRVGVRNLADVDLLYNSLIRNRLWAPEVYMMDGVAPEVAVAIRHYATHCGFTVVNNRTDEMCRWVPLFNAAAGNPAAGNPAAGDPAAGDPAAGNPAVGNPAVSNPAAGNPAVGNPAAGHPAAGHPAAGDPAAVDPAAVDPAAVEPAAVEQQNADIAARGRGRGGRGGRGRGRTTAASRRRARGGSIELFRQFIGN